MKFRKFWSVGSVGGGLYIYTLMFSYLLLNYKNCEISLTSCSKNRFLELHVLLIQRWISEKFIRHFR